MFSGNDNGTIYKIEDIILRLGYIIVNLVGFARRLRGYIV